MQSPASISIDSVGQILDDFDIPLGGYVNLGNVHCNDNPGKQKAGTTISASPMAIFQLELLVELESIARTIMKTLRDWKRW